MTPWFWPRTLRSILIVPRADITREERAKRDYHHALKRAYPPGTHTVHFKNSKQGVWCYVLEWSGDRVRIQTNTNAVYWVYAFHLEGHRL